MVQFWLIMTIPTKSISDAVIPVPAHKGGSLPLKSSEGGTNCASYLYSV